MANKSLEIRINSLDDAKSVVQNQVEIARTIENLSLDSVDFNIAREIQVEAIAMIHGIFRIKTFTSIVAAKDDNVLYCLQHFRRPTPRVEPAQPVPVVAKNRGGRPRRIPLVATETVNA